MAQTIVAISGSLRSGSNNSALIEAAARLAPGEIEIYRGVGDLPHFNPDIEEAGRFPVAVEAWRALAARADALLISCPEYARGIPGAFKNALDWLVGYDGFSGKPVALFNASPRGVASQEALKLVLTTIGCTIVEEACLTLPLLGAAYDAERILVNAEYKAQIERALAVLRDQRGLRA